MRFDDLMAEIHAANPEIMEIAHEVDPPYILASNVMRIRNRLGMTQAQLAEAVGVAQPRIAEVERGDANPRLVTLAKLAHALGITLPELLEDNLYGDRSAASAIQDAAAESAAPSPRKRRAG